MENLFQEWAYVELMGHNKICGLVSEYKFGGESMIRVDVPEVGDIPKFSKLFNISAIYAITPMLEADAKAYAKIVKAVPLDQFDMSRILAAKMKQLEIESKTAYNDRDDEGDDIIF
jgi:hypothetical protein